MLPFMLTSPFMLPPLMSLPCLYSPFPNFPPFPLSSLPSLPNWFHDLPLSLPLYQALPLSSLPNLPLIAPTSMRSGALAACLYFSDAWK